MLLVRLLAGLAAAALGAVVGLVIGAVLSALLPETVAQVGGTIFMILLPIVAFVWTYRRLQTDGERRRQAAGEIADRKEDAIDRKIAQKAQAIARGLAQGGTWQSATLRVTGGDSPSIDALQDGEWATVFAARYHPGKEGQVVPSSIQVERPPFVTPTPKWYRPTWKISSRTVGDRPAYWEVLAYRPGAWEDELDPLVEAAEKAAFENEKSRFGV
jgi:hypothetical protein